MSIEYNHLNGLLLEDGSESPRLMSMTFLASVLLHALIASAFLVLPGHASRKDITPAVINVSMVSLSDMGGPSAETESDAVAAPEPPVAEAPADAPLVTADTVDVTTNEIPMAEEIPLAEETVTPPPAESTPPPPEPKEEVFIKEAPEAPPAPKPVKRIAPKPETEKPKMIAKAVVKPEETREESIKDAIQRVRKKMAREQQGRSPGKTARSTGSGTGPGRGGAGIDDIYKAQLSYQVERNWVFSDQLAGGNKHLKSVVVIRILPTGHIQDIWFEQRSGNGYLDDSAYKAVMKSNPLPPLPKGYPEYTIALVFTPSGLR